MSADESIRCPVCHNPAESSIETAQGTRYEHSNLKDMDHCIRKDDGTTAVVGNFNTISETMKAPDEVMKLKAQSDAHEFDKGLFEGELGELF